MVVVTLEELTLLVTVQGRIPGIEVQNPSFRRSVVGSGKLIKRHRVNGPGGLFVGALLQATHVDGLASVSTREVAVCSARFWRSSLWSLQSS